MRSKTAAFLFLLVGLLSACHPRPKDPLDWQIDARSPSHLEDWMDVAKKDMPPELLSELNHALSRISAGIPFYKGYDLNRYEASDDPLCNAVDKKTVRAVLQDGYEAWNTALSLEINRNLENRNRNVTTKDQLPPGQEGDQDMMDWNATLEGKIVARDEAQVKENKLKIANLAAHTP